ncbi:hypothetical protein [Roseateles sp. P5_E4]
MTQLANADMFAKMDAFESSPQGWEFLYASPVGHGPVINVDLRGERGCWLEVKELTEKLGLKDPQDLLRLALYQLLEQQVAGPEARARLVGRTAAKEHMVREVCARAASRRLSR